MRKKSPGLLQALAEYFDVYLPTTRGVSQNTITSYQYAFRLLFEFMENEIGIPPEKMTFDSLTDGNVLRYLLWLEEERGCSAKTRNQRRAAIVSFAKYSAKKSLTLSLAFVSEVLDIPKKKVPKDSDVRYFTKEEISILLNMPLLTSEIGRRDAVLMSMLYSSGARAQEICDLTLNDISFGTTTTIRFVGKGQKARTIVIPDRCASLLNGFIKSRNLSITDLNTKNRHVFSSQTNEKMSISCVEAIVAKYVCLAKGKHPQLFRKPGYSPHSFRHSISVHMLECGESLAVIRAFLGHASISSTLVYATVTPELASRYLRERNEGVGIPEINGANEVSLKALPFLSRSTTRR
jgi:site-specific recombinase XerD